MMEEERTISAEAEPNTDGKLPDDEGVDLGIGNVARGDVDFSSRKMMNNGTMRTLDGKMAGDELEWDSINYQVLLGKIDGLLDALKLDA